jgi:hypothetical protein
MSSKEGILNCGELCEAKTGKATILKQTDSIVRLYTSDFFTEVLRAKM